MVSVIVFCTSTAFCALSVVVLVWLAIKYRQEECSTPLTLAAIVLFGITCCLAIESGKRADNYEKTLLK